MPPGYEKEGKKQLSKGEKDSEGKRQTYCTDSGT